MTVAGGGLSPSPGTDQPGGGGWRQCLPALAFSLPNRLGRRRRRVLPARGLPAFNLTDLGSEKSHACLPSTRLVSAPSQPTSPNSGRQEDAWKGGYPALPCLLPEPLPFHGTGYSSQVYILFLDKGMRTDRRQDGWHSSNTPAPPLWSVWKEEQTWKKNPFMLVSSHGILQACRGC